MAGTTRILSKENLHHQSQETLHSSDLLLEDLSKDLKSCQKQLCLEKQRRESMDAKLVSFFKEYSESQQRSQEREAQTLRMLEEKEKENIELTSIIQKLNANKRELEAQNTHLVDIVTKLKLEVNALSCNELQEELEIARETLQEVQESREQLRESLISNTSFTYQGLEAQKTNLLKDIHNLKQDVDTSERKLTSKDQEINDLKEKLERQINEYKAINLQFQEEKKGFLSLIKSIEREKQALEIRILETGDFSATEHKPRLLEILRSYLRERNYEEEVSISGNNVVFRGKFKVFLNDNQLVVFDGKSYVGLEEFLKYESELSVENTLALMGQEAIERALQRIPTELDSKKIRLKPSPTRKISHKRFPKSVERRRPFK